MNLIDKLATYCVCVEKNYFVYIIFSKQNNKNDNGFVINRIFFYYYIIIYVYNNTLEVWKNIVK